MYVVFGNNTNRMHIWKRLRDTLRIVTVKADHDQEQESESDQKQTQQTVATSFFFTLLLMLCLQASGWLHWQYTFIPLKLVCLFKLILIQKLIKYKETNCKCVVIVYKKSEKC